MMKQNILQVDYQKLQEIATRFNDKADDVHEIERRITAYVDEMGWDGVGADAFRHEVHNVLIPIFLQLRQSLLKGGVCIDEMMRIYQQAEEESAGYFREQVGRDISSALKDTAIHGLQKGASFRPNLPVDGQIYDANGNLVEGDVNKIFVPGIGTDMTSLKGHLGNSNLDAGFVGLYNQSEGMPKDIFQAINDRLSALLGLRSDNNEAVNTLKKQIANAVHDNRPFEIKAHSQGGAITAAALSELASEGYSAESLSKIKVTTYGTAGTFFPDGPQYKHYVINLDYVPIAVENLTLTQNYYSNRVVLPHISGDPHSMDNYYKSIQRVEQGELSIGDHIYNFGANQVRNGLVLYQKPRMLMESVFNAL